MSFMGNPVGLTVTVYSNLAYCTLIHPFFISHALHASSGAGYHISSKQPLSWTWNISQETEPQPGVFSVA